MQRQSRMAVRWLALATTIGMFLVLVMGSAVTNTGSEHGCGRSWPLCHGQFIPQMALQTMIEFSHRAVVGVETILILALAASALALYWNRIEMRILATLMVVFLFLQAGLGAWAVMAPQLPAALALHFGVSLIAFASVLLTTVFLFEVNGTERLRNDRPPRGFRAYVLGVTLYSYVVVYLGAFVRHTNATLACHGWPLCNGQVVPVFHGHVGSVFVHRAAAGLLTIAIAALVVWTYRFNERRPDLYVASVLTFGLVALQAFSGALVVWTRLDIFSALTHAGLVALMFGGLTYLCLHVLPIGQTEREVAGAAVQRTPATVSH